MASAIPDEFGNKINSKVKCANCQYEFNFIHSMYGSVTAVRLGSVWIFKCPNCNQKQHFDLRDHEYDPSIPTYVDPNFRRLFSTIIPLVIGLIISEVVLGIYLPTAYKDLALLPLIPFVIAIVWLGMSVMKTSKLKKWTTN